MRPLAAAITALLAVGPAVAVTPLDAPRQMPETALDAPAPLPPPAAGDTVASDVPEPAVWALIVAGFAVVGAAARRRRSGRIVTS